MIEYNNNNNNKGLVAQWTRACGYEPQGRGFESLLAHGNRVLKKINKH